MAVFFHNNRSTTYQMDLGPFAADLVLLQGSSFTPDYWKPVMAELGAMPPAGGRILTCDWSGESGRPAEEQAEDFVRLVETLGLHSIHIVATDDAAEVVGEAAKRHPDLFNKTLLIPVNVPKGEELARAGRAVCSLLPI